MRGSASRFSKPWRAARRRLASRLGGACDALADGELGTALGRDDDLAAAIDRLLTEPPPKAQALAGRVRARFGRAAFASRLRRVVETVCRPA